MSGYLLDANVLITPHKQYYPFDFAPSFWEQLANVLRRKNATILRVVSNEILDKMNDSLSEWFKGIKEDIKIPSVKRNQKVHDNYALVLQYIQTCGFYTNTALLNWARDGVADPWLIATAMDNGYKNRNQRTTIWKPLQQKSTKQSKDSRCSKTFPCSMYFPI